MDKQSETVFDDRFSMVEVWADAAGEIRSNIGVLLRALLLPAFAIGLLDLLSLPAQQGGLDQTPASLRFIAALLSSILGAVLAVSCHRIVLRSAEDLGNPWGLYLDRRVGAYLFTLIVIVLMSMVVLIVLAALPMLMLQAFPVFAALLLIPASLIAAWVIGRYSLVLPARAIGEPVSLDEVWSWSRGRSVRVVLATLLPVFGASLALIPVDLLIRNGPETLAFRWLTLALVSLVIGMITAVTLSCTYRRLRPD